MEQKNNSYIQLNEDQIQQNSHLKKRSSSSYLETSQQMELMWDQVNIRTMKPKKKLFKKQSNEQKQILEGLKGIVRPG